MHTVRRLTLFTTPNARWRTKPARLKRCLIPNGSVVKGSGRSWRTCAWRRIPANMFMRFASSALRRSVRARVVELIVLGVYGVKGANEQILISSCSRFSSWNTNAPLGSPEYYSKQHYTRGLKCWNGPERSITVRKTLQFPCRS